MPYILKSVQSKSAISLPHSHVNYLITDLSMKNSSEDRTPEQWTETDEVWDNYCLETMLTMPNTHTDFSFGLSHSSNVVPSSTSLLSQHPLFGFFEGVHRGQTCFLRCSIRPTCSRHLQLTWKIRRWHWGKGSSPEAPKSYPSKVGFFCPLVATNGTSAALFILVFYCFFSIHYNNLLNLWKKATTKQILTDYPEG